MFGPDYAQYGFVPDLYQTMRDNLIVITGDEYDIFGDGSVTIVSTPGHTPGHQSVLVRLADRGPVMLSGDMAHFWDNFCCRRVPHMNASEKKTEESMDKVDAMVRAEGAELWINHDWEQNQKIPHAPEWISWDCEASSRASSSAFSLRLVGWWRLHPLGNFLQSVQM